MPKLVKCTLDFSEGKRTDVIEAVINKTRERIGIKLLYFHSDYDLNLTTVTFIGKPEIVKKTIFDIVSKCIEQIEMEKRSGFYPSIGAVDQISFYPLKDIDIDETKTLAEEVGEDLNEKLNLPIYFCGENARHEDRRKSENIRRQGYRELVKEICNFDRKPDIGEKLHLTAGAVILRAITVTYLSFKIYFNTKNEKTVRKIASALNSADGGLANVQAIGFLSEKNNLGCVFLKISNYLATPLYRALEASRIEARRYGISVVKTILVGILPTDAFRSSLEYYLQLEDLKGTQILENHLLEV